MNPYSLTKLVGSAVSIRHRDYFLPDGYLFIKSYKLCMISSVEIELADPPNNEKVLSITFNFSDGTSKTFKKMDDFSDVELKIDGCGSIQEYLISNEIQFL